MAYNSCRNYRVHCTVLWVQHGENMLPVTLVDQLQLWEGERRRVVQQRGQLYSEFDSEADYALVLGFARRSNALLYENADRRVLVVTPDGHDEVKRLWKQHKRALAAASAVQ